MPRRVVQLTVSQYVDAEPGRNRSCSRDGQPDDVNIADGGDAFQREHGPSGCDRRPRSPALPDPFVGYAQALELLDVGEPIEDEVVQPYLARARRSLQARPSGRDPLARATTGHLQIRDPPEAMCPAGTHRVAITAQSANTLSTYIARF